MPRKRQKTDADRPVYRPSAPTTVPKELEPFFDRLELRRIVERYGMHNVQFVLARIAEQQRREMIERRSQEIRDAWKEKLRPLGPIRAPRPVAGRRWHRHTRTREESLDNVIAHQARLRELEKGLNVMLERAIHLDSKHQFVEIVDRTKAGETAAQIAGALGISERTVETRLAELRKAAVTEEELSAV